MLIRNGESYERQGYRGSIYRGKVIVFFNSRCIELRKPVGTMYQSLRNETEAAKIVGFC